MPKASQRPYSFMKTSILAFFGFLWPNFQKNTKINGTVKVIYLPLPSVKNNFSWLEYVN
jgi:hypothetical protein